MIIIEEEVLPACFTGGEPMDQQIFCEVNLSPGDIRLLLRITGCRNTLEAIGFFNLST